MHHARVDPGRLWRRLMRLAEITEPEAPWTRRAFTPRFLDGRAWLTAEFEAAGLATRLDAAGNLIGRMEGADPGAAPILIGSHSDTVPSGGRFDGMLGVVAALEVAQTIGEAGLVHRRSLEVVDFLSEEPSDFGLSCIGSRALAGQLSDAMLELARADGMSLAEGIVFVGGRPDDLAEACRAPGDVAAYLEVHIEQGRILETSGIDIGVVTGIAGIRRDRIVVEGRADHAGTTPMELRRDALVGAARLVDLVYREARHRDVAPLVATVGRIDVSPNAANAVPGRVEMILETRADRTERIDGFVTGIVERGEALAHEMELTLAVEEISSVDPVPCAVTLQEAVEAAAREHGLSSRRMPSGAGHDGVFIAPLGPIGMIFTPCRDGRSHCPEEWADQSACRNGAETLLSAVLRLDAKL